MMMEISFGSPAWGLNDYADLASVVIAALALAVALASIWLSIRATNWQKLHNEMSVAPLPYVHLGDYQDNIYVKLTNCGIGPLIVKSISVTDGKKTENDILSFMPDLPDGLSWSNYTKEFRDRPISSENEITLIELNCDEKNSNDIEFREKCRKILSSLTVSCNYTDMYGKVFSAYNRKLTWFLRKNV